MATGASTCDLAVILVDARNGVVTQTKRHSFIVSLLGIKHVLVAVNKMDLVGFSQEVFEQIRATTSEFAARLDIPDLHFIPISALRGDNVVDPSPNMPWYQGSTLMHFPGQRLHRLGPQPGGFPFSGPVGQPSASGFPRLLRHDRFGNHPPRRRDHGAAVAEDQPRQIDRHVRRRAGRSVRAAGRHA
jgi:hypothetical protein